jgi:hypothetical protein
MFLFKYFGPILGFYNTNNTYYISQSYTAALLHVFPKHLIPWRDSSPGYYVLEAEAMTAMPRRQGQFNVLLISFCCNLLLYRRRKFFFYALRNNEL